MDTESILSQLNDSQREAVVSTEGPSLVIAGAGSGKTRVLTYKIAYLLHIGVKPWNILALTFTNKAAREMKDRIGSLVGSDVAARLVMGTFHSVFSRILRVEADRLGYTPNFTIYDEADSRSLLKNIIKEMGLDDKIYKPASVHGRISMAKNRLITAEDYAGNRSIIENDSRQRVPNTYKVYKAYAARCRQANAMDFDDLLLLTHNLFRDNDDIRRKYAGRFMYVLVDEYQDTNTVQQKIVFQLTCERKNVCVVGDDAQSIYSFRGANIDNILDFREMYGGAKLFKLERNYRSTQHIVEAANSLIRHNERQIPKKVYSKNGDGNKLTLKPTYSDREEAVVVCNEIMAIRRREKGSWDDFAILYRTNAQSRPFEEVLRHANIPYRVYGGLSFYQRKEIKDIIAYMRLVANPDDDEALRRVINYPARGIGATTVSKIYARAYEASMSMWEVMSHPVKAGLDVNKGTLAKLNAFRELITQFIARRDSADAYTLGREIINSSGIQKDLYSDSSPEYVSRQENLEELLSGLQDFVEDRREEGDSHCLLVDYLQEVSLLSDLDSDDDADAARVTMMTIHSAKGLEFPTVFVVGLEENIFPSPMSADSRRGLEEERRLLYVAITRAERNCILTCARNRFRYGKMEFDTPSRFLSEIDPSLIHVDSDAGNTFFTSTSRPSPVTYGGGRYQNSHPVASQFRADPKLREAAHRTERAADPLSPAFRRTLGNMRRAGQAPATAHAAPRPSGRPASSPDVRVGATIEHDRFGIGKVMSVEGTGENARATVDFRNAGTKKLLLKFARFKVIG